MRKHLLERLRGQPERPLGAYALTRNLEASLGRNVTATSVYRSLDFLMRHDLVMRIESRNAYLPSPTPGRPFTGAFLVCERCGGVTCVKDASLSGFLAGKAARLGFSVRRRIVELHGICARCSAVL
jgi:Fur family zinc uptake transcriptional regulator